MNAPSVLSQVWKLLELPATYLASISSFVLMHLRDVTNEAVAKSETLPALWAPVRLLFLVYAQHMLVQVSTLSKSTVALSAAVLFVWRTSAGWRRRSRTRWSWGAHSSAWGWGTSGARRWGRWRPWACRWLPTMRAAARIKNELNIWLLFPAHTMAKARSMRAGAVCEKIIRGPVGGGLPLTRSW